MGICFRSIARPPSAFIVRIARNARRFSTLLRRCEEIVAALDTQKSLIEISPLWMDMIVRHYPTVVREEVGHAEINAHELKVFSQNGEDGILLYLFSQIGANDRRFVEFGVQDGRECNTANLSLHFGWSGLLLEGNSVLASSAAAYYSGRLGSSSDRVRVAPAFITVENVNSIFQDNLVTGDIDLLSIDIDGNDYWIWKALDAVRPRVVVIEYNPVLGPSRSVTVPYSPTFDARSIHPTGYYAGASLTALTALAATKGYVLVGCCSDGVNAFYVRADVAEGHLVPVTPAVAFYRMSDRWIRAISKAAQVEPTADPYTFVERFPWQVV